MRLATKILLAFGILLLTAVGAVVFFAGRSAAGEVRGTLSRGDFLPATGLARVLAGYYRGHQSWDGVETIFEPKSGMMSGMMEPFFPNDVLLLDSNQRVVYDSKSQSVGQIYIPTGNPTILPIRVGNETEGSLVVFETANNPPEAPFMPGLYRAFTLAAILAAVVGLAIALILSQSLTSPLRRLTDTMNRFALGDRNIPLSGTSHDEVGDLNRSFHQMMKQIELQEELRKEMTADIAHELRTPLSVLRANLDALADGVYPLTAESLLPLQESTLLLSRLVDDLRVLALADAGQLTLEMTEIVPGAFLQRIAGRFASTLKERNLELQVSIANDLPPIQGDSQRLEQVIGNLISNAISAMPGAGQLSLGADFYGGRVRFLVEDTGPGIPEDKLETIFERFFRLAESRHRAEIGSGLGLAIARKLMEAQGGTICAENRAEGGARFIIELPAVVKK
jgi:signal transduction histidine kinase